MNPTTLLILGLIALVIGATGALLNLASVASGRRSIISVMVCHVLAALFWVSGGITTLVAIVMFLINYAKS